jgi:hypothetical protein
MYEGGVYIMIVSRAFCLNPSVLLIVRHESCKCVCHPDVLGATNPGLRVMSRSIGSIAYTEA